MTASARLATVTIVVDNNANDGLAREHGFSVWLQTAGLRLLFDTGQGPALASNAGALHIPVQSADVLILSHGHYDHTGGMPQVLGHDSGGTVHCHPAATRLRYAVRDGSARLVGMPAEARTALERLPPGRRRPASGPTEVAPDIGISGPMPRLTSYKDTGGPFFLDAAGTQPNLIEDDLALWIRTALGLVVIVGCSHAGLVNTLSHSLEVSGASRLHAVIGGFHLLDASHERIDRTIGALLDFGPDLVVPCHCTGDRMVERLERALGPRVEPGAAGARYTFELVSR